MKGCQLLLILYSCLTEVGIELLVVLQPELTLLCVFGLLLQSERFLHAVFWTFQAFTVLSSQVVGVFLLSPPESFVESLTIFAVLAVGCASCIC